MAPGASSAAKEFVNANEISERLGVCYLTALNLMKHDLPLLRIGKLYRVRRTDFEKWLKSHTR